MMEVRFGVVDVIGVCPPDNLLLIVTITARQSVMTVNSPCLRLTQPQNSILCSVLKDKAETVRRFIL